MQVDPDNVRPVQLNLLLEAEKVAEATKQALKRKIEQAAAVDVQSRSLPPKLRINPEDPEDVVRSLLNTANCFMISSYLHVFSPFRCWSADTGFVFSCLISFLVVY